MEESQDSDEVTSREAGREEHQYLCVGNQSPFSVLQHKNSHVKGRIGEGLFWAKQFGTLEMGQAIRGIPCPLARNYPLLHAAGRVHYRGSGDSGAATDAVGLMCLRWDWGT